MRIRLLLAPVVVIASIAAQTQFASFVRQHLPPYDGGTFSTVLADVDRDGDPDYLLGTAPRLHLWINDGQGRFADETNVRLPVMADASITVIAADVNADGALDLFLANYNTQSVLLVNDGAGRFRDATATHLPVLVDLNVAAAAGDVDGDGDNDLVIGTYLGRTRLLINDGTGRFTEGTVGRLPALFTPTANLVLVDLERDGDLDVVEGNRWQGAKVYRNDGTGHFTNATLQLLPLDPVDGWVVVGDVDRDGDSDAWFGGGEAVGDRLLINDGSGRFTNESATRLPREPLSSQSVVLADLDGDGALDAYLTKTFDGDRLYHNDGTGHFTDVSATARPTSNTFPVLGAAGDVDGDGDVDVLVGATWLGQPWILINDGAGRFANGMPMRLPMRSGFIAYANAFAAGDVDGDGTLDLVLATATSGNPGQFRVELNLNDGHGVLRDASARMPDASAALSTGLALGDIDLDGDLDLVVAVWYGVARVLVNDGRGNFTEPAPSALPWMTASDVALFDVDADGDLDLFVAALWCRLWLNDGHGGFTEATATHLPQTAVDWMTAGDLDGDGDLDLVCTWAAGRNSILINGSQGHFADESITRLPATRDSSWPSALADVDGDGDPDLAIGNYSQNQDRLYLNDGRGFFTDVTSTHMPTDTDSARAVAFGDLDGDGRPDLVIGNDLQSRIYRNDGSGRFSDVTSARLPEVVTQTHSVAIADFDGDGALDVLFGNVGKDVLYLNHRHRIVAPLLPRLGFDYQLDYYVEPGFARGGGMVMQFMGGRRAAAPIPVPPFGTWGLDPAVMFPLPLVAIPAPGGQASVTYRLPSDLALAGAGIFVQGIAQPTPDSATWRFTNLLEDRILR